MARAPPPACCLNFVRRINKGCFSLADEGVRPTQTLATPARTPAASAAVAASITGHDGSAEAAGGGIAQVDESGESVGGVD